MQIRRACCIDYTLFVNVVCRTHDIYKYFIPDLTQEISKPCRLKPKGMEALSAA
jgi:hypothetical protein